MTIGKVLFWFYRLNMGDAILLLAVCSAMFCWMEMKLEYHSWWRWAITCLLVALMAAILYTTVGNRSTDPVREINLIPFHSYRAVLAGANPELYRSNFMNAALFYPAGLLATSLLPKKWPGWGKCLLVVLLLAAMSAGIEYAQYRYALGQVEIDDVIHNTAGALAGALAAVLLPPVLSFAKEKLVQKYLQWR